jgi:biotin carboxyl carrier protein
VQSSSGKPPSPLAGGGNAHYRVHLDEATFEVDLAGTTARVGETTHTISFEELPGGFSLIMDGRSYRLHGEADADGAIKLTVDGITRTATAKNERNLLLERYRVSDASHAHEQEVRAPMPGLVVKILVDAGAIVTRGQGLVILEAMKMENELRAPHDGAIVRIHVASGEAVQKNQILIELG